MTTCNGWKDSNSQCGAYAKSGDVLCRHHQYQHRYTDWERPEIAEMMTIERKRRQMASLRALKMNQAVVRNGLRDRQCHSCNVYSATEWDEALGCYRCKRH